MKVNEAPEKIWLNDDWFWQFDDKDFMGEDSVEYTRTDALIEDACKWLKENTYLYVNDYTGSLNEDKLVEDFRKYWKESEI